MAVRYFYNCPYCGKQVNVTKHPIHYDGPFKNCPFCRKIYVDPHGKECALAPYRPLTVFQHLKESFPGAFLSVPLAVILSFFTKNGPLALRAFLVSFPVFWGLSFLLSLCAREGSEKIRLKKWRESDRRLRDQAYAIQLANLGYSVPSHYLPADFNPDPASCPYKRAKITAISTN